MAEKLTLELIKKLPLSTDGKQSIVMDTVTPGFGIRVGSQSKTFIVVKRMPHGTPKKVTLGKFGSLTLEAARKLAQDFISQLAHGVDVNQQKRAVKTEKRAIVEEQKKEESNDKQTLQWLFDEYKNEQLIKNNGGSEGTLSSMGECFKMMGARQCQTLIYNEKKKTWSEGKLVNLESWLDRPLRSITTKEILDRFEVMEITRPKRLIGGVLKPMGRTHQIAYKFAMSAFEWFIPRNYHQTNKQEMLDNPFKILTIYKKWKAVGVRTRVVDFTDVEVFGTWWNAILDYRAVNEVAADYMQYSILQAGRSIEMVNMTWDMVNLKKRQVTYEKTKNGDDYTMPLSDIAYEILERRRAKNPKSSNWVWDYPESKTGHIPKDTKHHFHQLTERGAVFVSTHDLKRTWASAVASLNKYGDREIDYILKHARSDVGIHYFIKNEILLKEILQSVENLFVGLVAKHNASKNEVQEVSEA
ncbi:integrase family protein [Variovorax sp. RA8]|uniref:integrase family protein n=1 Tax=Variovorax sp. (strain JCM 16519 / RA8) TaxID=662548 RepID=UPI000A4E76A4|nr:integrase family protein [Variovorax sp. RA8]VTU34329.1 Phage integrase family protein [Variovorax sp. RA8]